MKEKCKNVLSFLKEYSGKQYRKLEKCTSEEERQYMIDGHKAGSSAREAFEYLVDIIEKRCGLEHDRITQWQNSGTFVSYFWCQMKKPAHRNSQISLSLFAEKAGTSFRLRISVELAIEKASDEDLHRYRQLLNKPLEPTLVYVSGGNNETEFRILDERDNNVVRNMGLKKVQVSAIIDENQLDADLPGLFANASDRLISYYDGLFEETTSEIKNTKVDDTGEKDVVEMSTKDALNKIKNYIFAHGFTYPDGLIENFYLSLKSKPFVILAGTSGTGKTKLVKLFAEAIGATSAEGGGNGRYKLVSVRPDWSDSSDLFGHVNLKGEFVPGAVIDFIDKAVHDIENPYFLCLDEMNLARVEYYLSDFLSLMETRRKHNDEIITDEVILDKAAKGKYQSIYLPENLYIIGTVNMDETTFPFSKKVLDRANTIEFSYVDLVPSFEDVEKNVEPIVQKNEFLKPEYILLKVDIPAMYYSDVTGICEELQDINRILQTAQEHVGYRVRDEIVFYMINNKVSSLLSYEDAMDNEIMQKILPRIQGSSSSIKEMLCELFKKFAGDYTGLNQSNISDQMQAYIDSKDSKYRKSAEKLCYMMRRFEEDGFTSFWL